MKTDEIRVIEKHMDMTMTSSLVGEILSTEHSVNFWFLKSRSFFLVQQVSRIISPMCKWLIYLLTY